MKKKIMLMVVIVGIALVFIVVVLFFQKSSKPLLTFPEAPSTPANFLSYENSNYGIKIRYPQNWTKEETQEGMVVFKSSPDNEFNALNILVEKTQDRNVNLEDLNNLQFGPLQNRMGELTKDDFKHFPISGKPNAASLDYFTAINGQNSLKCMQVAVIGSPKIIGRENTFYIITYCAEANRYDEFLDTAKQMVNSLQIFH